MSFEEKQDCNKKEAKRRDLLKDAVEDCPGRWTAHTLASSFPRPSKVPR